MMSVLSCERSGCPNVMCDNMIIGKHICGSCLNELNRVRRDWPQMMNTEELRRRIGQFFDTEPSGQLVNTDDEFERLRRDKY